MQTLEQFLPTLEYPGRFLILGQSGEQKIAIYGVTARSASSRARIYVYNSDKKTIDVQPTDAQVMGQGNVSLLQYTAIRLEAQGLVAANGRQCDLVTLHSGSTAAQALEQDLSQEEFEPDSNLTPRITSCFIRTPDGADTAALHIVRADANGFPSRSAFPVALTSGQGAFISTYAGPNGNPTPSFATDPVLLQLEPGSAAEQAQRVWAALSPQNGAPDLRVAVVAVSYTDNPAESQFEILNAAELLQ